MDDTACHCSAHDPNGRLERTIQSASRANRAKLWAIRGIDARIAHSADNMTLETARRKQRHELMYKNIAATLQSIERVQRHGRDGEHAAGPPQPAPPAPGEAPMPAAKLGPLQKIIAFGPLVETAGLRVADRSA